jgi:hypothetical protein
MKGVQEVTYSNDIQDLEQKLRDMKCKEYKQFRKEYQKKYQKEYHQKKTAEQRKAKEEELSSKRIADLERIRIKEQQKYARHLASIQHRKDYQKEYYETQTKQKRKQTRVIYNIKQNIKHAEKVHNTERYNYWTQQLAKYEQGGGLNAKI